MILLLQLKESIYYYLMLTTLFSESYSCFDRYLEMLLFSYFYPPPPSTERGRHFLIWSIRVNAAEQGMVSEPLSLKQGIRFHLWLASWVGCLVRRNPLRECESLAMTRLHLVPTIFVFPKSLSPWRYFEKLLIIIFMQSETKQGLKN